MTENIQIQVDDSEVDAAVAKLNAALIKSNQLTTDTAATVPSSTGYSEEDTLSASLKPDFTVKQTELNVLQRETDEISKTVESTISTETRNISIFNKDARRVISQIPTLREAYRLASEAKSSAVNGLESVSGTIGHFF